MTLVVINFHFFEISDFRIFSLRRSVGQVAPGLFRVIKICLFSFFIVLYQKRLKKERKARRRLQEQLELEMKRRSQLEEAIKTSNNPAEALRLINGELKKKL